jgi:hypothetical protein
MDVKEEELYADKQPISQLQCTFWRETKAGRWLYYAPPIFYCTSQGCKYKEKFEKTAHTHASVLCPLIKCNTQRDCEGALKITCVGCKYICCWNCVVKVKCSKCKKEFHNTKYALCWKCNQIKLKRNEGCECGQCNIYYMREPEEVDCNKCKN